MMDRFEKDDGKCGEEEARVLREEAEALEHDARDLERKAHDMEDRAQELEDLARKLDGGCRPPPIGMELAVVAGGRSIIKRGLGLGTSMDAEWLALIEAMRCAHTLGLVDPVLLGDALAVIAQARGMARCPPAYARRMEAFRLLPRPAGRVRIRYVKRTQNLAGIALAGLPRL